MEAGEGKCSDGSCECSCSEAVVRTKFKQIVLAREKREEDAETRRRAFVKQHWPLRFFYELLMLVPLIVFLSIEKVEPALMKMYHDRFAYTAVALTVIFIFLGHWKRRRVDREFEKLHPEDAETLAWCDDDEDE